MIIHTVTVGSGANKHERYFIQDGQTDLCYFDTLTTAGIVTRFLRGSHLSKDDYDIAVAAMKAWDERKEGDQA